jgi:hypothetical protein
LNTLSRTNVGLSLHAVSFQFSILLKRKGEIRLLR